MFTFFFILIYKINLALTANDIQIPYKFDFVDTDKESVREKRNFSNKKLISNA